MKIIECKNCKHPKSYHRKNVCLPLGGAKYLTHKCNCTKMIFTEQNPHHSSGNPLCALQR